jgi:hypothetical protein
MSKLTDNKWAFPLPEFAYMEGRRGMTLRQWYAGMALQGVLSDPQSASMTCEAVAECCFMVVSYP